MLRSAVAPCALTVMLPGPDMLSPLLTLSIAPLLVRTMSPEAPPTFNPPPPLPILSVPGTARSLLINTPSVLVTALRVPTWVWSGSPAVPMPVDAESPRLGAVTSTIAPLAPSRILPLALVSVVAPAEERPVASDRLAPVEIVVVVPAFHDDVSPSTAPMVSRAPLPFVKLTERLVLTKAKVSTEFPLLVRVMPALRPLSTRSTEAVICPSSVSARPSVPAASAPPSATVCDEVLGAIVTMPVPALIDCEMLILSAVRLTALLLVAMPTAPSTMPIVRVLGPSLKMTGPATSAATVEKPLLTLFRITGPALDTRRLAAWSEPKAASLMLPLLISASVLAPLSVMGAAIVMLPAMLLPIRRTDALIRLSSACVRPSTPGASLPPRLIAWPMLAGARLVTCVPDMMPLLSNIASAARKIAPLLEAIAVAPVLSTVSVFPDPTVSVMLPPKALSTISGALARPSGDVSSVIFPPAVMMMLPEVLLVTLALAFIVKLRPVIQFIPAAALIEPPPTPSPRLVSSPISTPLMIEPAVLMIPAPDPVLKSAVAPVASIKILPIAVMPELKSLIVPLLARTMPPLA